ncbi:MAG: TIGR03619 family F420-dependent LLM class oxidoreductase [Rhodospirillaceae bacterium]|nr:MAG: TIGR03619 family F420-dependent LLM class oxidoreductase [Rhodospirillaceae bacterium]
MNPVKKPKLAMILVEVWSMTDPRDLRKIVRYAVEAEEAGFDAVMIGEHVLMGANSCYLGPPSNPRDWLKAGNQVPDFPHPSGLPLIAAIAAATSRIRLIAAAVISPLRHPLVLAKEFATIDLLSEGRLVVVPTVSWQEEEYAALGVPFHKRGAILDEQLEIWKRLWTEGSPLSHAGAHFQFSNTYLYPEPYRAGGIPLWTGGRALGAPMRRRLARYSKGLFLLKPPSPEELKELAQELAANNRSLDEIELAAVLGAPFKSTTDRLDLGRVTDSYAELRDRGFSTFAIKPSQFIDDGAQLKKFAREAVQRLTA